MASPVVSGAAALLLQADPSLTPDTVKARLMASADKWTDTSGNADPCTYGAGYLDIPAALASTITPAQPALSPQLSMVNGEVQVNTNVIGSASVWGSKAISGVNTIFSSASMAASKPLRGSSFNAGVDLSSVALNGE